MRADGVEHAVAHTHRQRARRCAHPSAASTLLCTSPAAFAQLLEDGIVRSSVKDFWRVRSRVHDGDRRA
ncbi:hypothetical protein HMPREF1868_00525 [Olsenella sp. DNF00959]|nr:hypothetical protein HMPREF1868_00525 [Olsenella sp. DNF00959]